MITQIDLSVDIKSKLEEVFWQVITEGYPTTCVLLDTHKYLSQLLYLSSGTLPASTWRLVVHAPRIKAFCWNIKLSWKQLRELSLIDIFLDQRDIVELYMRCTVAIEKLLQPRSATGFNQQLVFTMCPNVPRAMGNMCLYALYLGLIFFKLMCLATHIQILPCTSVSTLDHNHYMNPYSSYTTFSEMKGLKLMTVNTRSLKGKIKQFRK